MRSGQHDGLGAALHQIAERRRRIGHGIGAVADHEAVVLFVVVPDGLRHPQPVLGLEIGAVQTVYLNAVHMAQFTDPGHKGQQLAGVQFRGQALRGHFAGNGAAGADHQDMLHMLLLIPFSRSANALQAFLSHVAVLHGGQGKAHRLLELPPLRFIRGGVVPLAHLL